MTRVPFLGVIAIGATLLVAPSAYAMPLGAAHVGRNVATGDAPSHAPKPRCVHNGISTNKAGHINCRATKTSAPTGDTAVPTFSSTGDPTPPVDTGPGTSSGSDQGDQNEQGDQGDQGGSGSDQGASGGDQGDQGSSGDQGGGGSGDQGNQNSDN